MKHPTDKARPGFAPRCHRYVANRVTSQVTELKFYFIEKTGLYILVLFIIGVHIMEYLVEVTSTNKMVFSIDLNIVLLLVRYRP